MKENILITSIGFVTVGAIILITNSVSKYTYNLNYSLPNDSKYKEMMDKIDDLDERLKKIEKLEKIEDK